MSFHLKLWGVRGSLPAPTPPEVLESKLINLLEQYDQRRSLGLLSPTEFIKSLPVAHSIGFGGHTSCVEVTTSKTSLIIDAGSGIRRLGEHLMLGPCGVGRGEVHILMTHFHWDHLIGLPFFIPIFVPGNQIHFYAVQPDLEENVRKLFQKPNFPVSFERLGAKLHFHKLTPRDPTPFGDIETTAYQLDHPDPCWGYRMTHNGRSYAHCVDSEAKRVSREELGPDLPLYENVDLMLFDAQYTFSEVTEKVDWGHASGPIGIDIALREGIKKILFVHHDPSAGDEKISKAEMQTREYYELCLSNLRNSNASVTGIDWCFAREGMFVEI